MFPLSFGPSQFTLGPENLVAFLHKINKCLPLCIIQFKVAFLDAAADCVEWQWFSKVLPSPMSIMVAWRLSQTIITWGSQWSCAFTSSCCPWPLRTEITPDSLNLFTILWTVDGERLHLRRKFYAILRWETLSLNWLTILSQSLAQSGEPRPILACQRLSLWWMLLLYSILKTSSSGIPVKLLTVESFQNSVTCNLFSLVLPLSQLFLSVLQASHSVVFLYLQNTIKFASENTEHTLSVLLSVK